MDFEQLADYNGQAAEFHSNCARVWKLKCHDYRTGFLTQKERGDSFKADAEEQLALLVEANHWLLEPLNESNLLEYNKFIERLMKEINGVEER